MSVILDGYTYNVRVTVDTLERSFEIVEGKNNGVSISGRKIRDILGTGYSYSMHVEPDPNDLSSYDAFYQQISAPLPYHSVTLPYGQSTITFNCIVTSGSDMYDGAFKTGTRWKGLTVNFEYYEPQRT